MYFDGSDVGLGGFAVDAFDRLPDGSLLLSFAAAGAVPDISGTTDDSDIVRFVPTSLGDVTAGTFVLYFDGSDVGLTTNDEDVDGVSVLPDGRILISTIGNFTVTGASGADEDVVEFTPTSLGATTAGTCTMYFDGSGVGLSNTSNEDVDALGIGANGVLYLSTVGAFTVTGVSGAGEDVFTFTPASLGNVTSGTYASALYFDGSLHGLSSLGISAIDVP